MSVTPGTVPHIFRVAVLQCGCRHRKKQKKTNLKESLHPAPASSVAKGNTEDLAGLAARFWALSQVPYEGDYPTLIDFTMRIIAATLRSTSSSVVAQQETEIRIAVCPCQIVPAHQQVPSV